MHYTITILIGLLLSGAARELQAQGGYGLLNRSPLARDSADAGRRLLPVMRPFASFSRDPESRVVRAEPVSMPEYTGALAAETGEASFYASRFHLRRTANGERYDQNALVAAHRTLPFGTLLRVTNLRNDRWTTVRINDRGPFARGASRNRIIDLSRRAAEEIGLIQQGHGPVRIEILEYGDGRNRGGR